MRLKPIPHNEFHAHVKKMHENRDYGFEEEYQVCEVLVITVMIFLFALEHWFRTFSIL